MAHQYKRHYGEYGDETLCGLATGEGESLHMLTNGEENVQKVSCKTCQKVLVARLNTGDDKMVEYQGETLVVVR